MTRYSLTTSKQTMPFCDWHTGTSTTSLIQYFGVSNSTSSSGTSFTGAYDTTVPVPRNISVDVGQEVNIKLPDGAVLRVAENGAYEVVDKDAKVTHRASNVREFNRYVNASDLIEEFINFLGTFGVRQSEVLKIPIELFINFLIVKAAEADGEKPPVEQRRLEVGAKTIGGPSPKPRCRVCGRYIEAKRKALGFAFCSATCAARFEQKCLSEVA